MSVMAIVMGIICFLVLFGGAFYGLRKMMKNDD